MGRKMRMLRGPAARIAVGMERRLTGEELRSYCDGLTANDLDSWELDKLTEWVEEHPAYQALPEESGESPANSEGL